MKLVVLDFESYYDPASGYSLDRMSTEDYVSDPRFEVILVTAKIVGPGADEYREIEGFSGTHEETAAWLATLDLENSALVCHHTMFDGLILAIQFGIYPAFYLCTESMVRPMLKPVLRSLSLASVAKHLGLGIKGDEVIRAAGKRRLDFTPEELGGYMTYGKTDTGLCYGIYKWARPQLSAMELRIIDMTLRMYMQPQLLLDAGVYEASLNEVRERKAKVLAEMEVMGITGKALRSNKQFAQILIDRGIVPPMKASPTSLKRGDVPPQMTYAFGKTDPEFIDLRAEYAEDFEIATILNARVSEKSSIEETRNEALLEVARRYRHYRVPVAYYAAHTGRYGGIGKTNPLNFPKTKRYELGADGKPKLVRSRVRCGVIAPPGFAVVAADKAQIEARIVATLAGQTDLVSGFASGECVYSACASGLFGRPVSRELANSDPIAYKDRQVGKAIILGSGYGMGPDKFQRTSRKDGLVLSDDEAYQYITYYRQRYEFIPEYWAACEAALRDLIIAKQPTQLGPVVFEWLDDKRTAGIRLPNGLHLIYPRLRMVKIEERWQVVCNQARDKAPRKLWGGILTENIVQALARINIVDDMIALQRELGLRTALQVYDDVVLVVPTDRVDALCAAVAPIMSRSPRWLPDLPVAVEINHGPSYGELTPWEKRETI